MLKQKYFILFIISVFILTGCKNKQSVKIGFSGCLTGRLNDLGIAGRNAVMLAVQEVNARGGINGRAVELIIRDDMNNPEKAVQVDKELIDLNVSAVIGHMTSAMSIAALPVMQKNRIIMISPTSTANNLTGKDDFLFRITAPDMVQTDIMAEYAFNKLGLRSISCIYDLSNKSFSSGWYENFQTRFEEMGGKISYIKAFTSETHISYKNLVKELLDSEPDGILIIAGALNTAMICQHIRQINPDIFVISSGWAGTQELIQHGGSAVEGIVFPQVFNKEDQSPGYLEFKKNIWNNLEKNLILHQFAVMKLLNIYLLQCLLQMT